MYNPFHRTPKPQGPVDFIIAGLGNPGRQYENTRHNAGFLTLDLYAEAHSLKIDRLKFKSLCGECVIGDKRVLLLKPQTFMNLSGQAVTEAARFYKIPPERTIIIYDDISLPPGKLRIRRKGSDGGHNGMKNIIYLSGSDQFPRIKVGVGAKPHPDYNLADWVLSAFKKDEIAPMKEAFQKAGEALELIVQGKTDEAMNRFNS
ncbi:MAG: aminoacyl-tRNA hydrolase [Clostridiales bacterium]|nr:aminoacyl-tRNA hydrolase [Clostridiales bacterium]